MRRPRGFTLIELLVVICIIGILAGLVTVGLNATMTASRSNSTELMLQTLSGALATYHTRWGDYPPTTLEEVGMRGINDTNNGVEALTGCLASTRRGGRILDVATEQLVNFDKDRGSKKVLDWYFGEDDLLEVTDYFGQVIFYMHHRDYAKPRSGMTDYVLIEGGERTKMAAEKSPQTKAYVNSDRFQVRSVGADGKPGTSDDIRVGN